MEKVFSAWVGLVNNHDDCSLIMYLMQIIQETCLNEFNKRKEAMISVIFVLGISLMAAAIEEEVLISEIDTGRSREIAEHLPDYIELDIQRKDGSNLRLQLRENKKIDINAPVYHTVTENGNLRTVKKEVRRIEGVKFYYDKGARAALKITCLNPQSFDCKKQVEGSLNLNGEKYDIKPSQDDIVVRGVPGTSPGVIHILERARINMENKDDEITTKYSGDASVKDKAHREIKDLLAEILNGYKRTKRQEAAKTQYAVEVIGVADPTFWTYMEKRIKPRDGMSKEATIEYEIRQRIAHIVHGVSLNYEDIDDKEFSIYITVSGFLMMKTLDASSPMAAYLKYTPEEGYPTITVERNGYLNAVINDVTKRGIPNDDHYMVFTWADLDKGALGIAYGSGCCYDNRVSVNEYNPSYEIMIVVASHELGHNLGAKHDHILGCPDFYIMYSGPTSLIRGDEEGTKHPWSFSTCSITSIKDFLKQWGNKCLLDHADIYDKNEWDSHISLLPGERYTADQQCKLVYGDDSYMCRREIPPTDQQFCQEMSCMDKDNNRCSYLNAARGTQCGFPSSNSHCIKGKCVKKEGPSQPLIKTGDSENCFKTFSELYQGTKSVTKSGLACQSWSVQEPHKHVLGKPEHFKDDSVLAASNYCRDPDGTGTPWCYLNTYWEFCDIPKCSAEKEAECTKKILEYQYKLTKTKSGYTCQRWDSQRPYSHRYTDPKQFPDATLYDAANFCRNPDGSPLAWCYTTSNEKRWDWCDTDINDICVSDSCYSDYVAYSGPKSVTKSGVKCQAWDKKEPHFNHYVDSPNLFPDKSVAAAGNSCRDPSKTGQPWCYLGITWEECDISKCT